MNATLNNGGKVHRLNGSVACCGVGKNRNQRHWQMELSEVTCLRCAKSLRSLRTATIATIATMATTIEQLSNEGPCGRPT